MSQSVVSLPGNSGGLTNIHTVPLPAGVTAGERLTVAIAFYLNSAPPTPAGWALLFARWFSSCMLCYYYKEADGSEIDVTFETFPGNPKSVGSAWVASRRSGHDPAFPPECFFDGAGRAGYGATTQTPNPPILSPSFGAVDAEYEAIAGWRSAPPPSAVVGFDSYPSGYSLSQANDLCNNNSGAGIACASLASSNGAENPPAFGLTAIAATVANTVAHKDA